jgi:hypothetical protein
MTTRFRIPRFSLVVIAVIAFSGLVKTTLIEPAFACRRLPVQVLDMPPFVNCRVAAGDGNFFNVLATPGVDGSLPTGLDCGPFPEPFPFLAATADVKCSNGDVWRVSSVKGTCESTASVGAQCLAGSEKVAAFDCGTGRCSFLAVGSSCTLQNPPTK